MILRAEGLTYRYERGQDLLRGIDLTIGEGGITALCAPNGEGKTTLLKLIAGLRFPRAGKLEVLGHDPAHRPLDLQQRMYFLATEPYFPDWSSRRIGDHYGRLYPNFDEGLFLDTLDTFGLDPDRPLRKVSFGQKRRAQLSLALATRTQLLLLDEPTTGLDIEGKEQFRRALVAGTEAGQTVLLATHLLEEISPVIDNLLILRNGRTDTHVDLMAARDYLSFNVVTQQPPYSDTGYHRRIPGGWLTIHADGRPSGAEFHLESLYLALVSGKVKLPTASVSGRQSLIV